MRFRCVFPFFCVLAFAAAAQAADTPAVVPVVFSVPGTDWRDEGLLDAIRQTLSRTPTFNLMSVVTPDALVIAVPGGLGRNGHEDNTSYAFTAVFFRNGDKIGESVEGCKTTALSDCADQLAADAQSAAAVKGLPQ